MIIIIGLMLIIISNEITLLRVNFKLDKLEKEYKTYNLVIKKWMYGKKYMMID